MGVASMLRIYICPKCYNFRMVSKKPDAVCLHCGNILDKIDIDYVDYINMTQSKRNELRENYKKRMLIYDSKLAKTKQLDDKLGNEYK